MEYGLPMSTNLTRCLKIFLLSSLLKLADLVGGHFVDWLPKEMDTCFSKGGAL